MFTEIDKVLYPNKCEVIQTTSHDFIYPIFKNGSSSLYQAAKENGWKIIFNHQIHNCKKIVIFLRNPIERFETGVDTFIKHCLAEGLDEKTVKYFINNYLFLNRHYMPQILWLIHLARYVKEDVVIDLKDISKLNLYTDIQKNKSNATQNNLFDAEKLKFYIEADNYLLNYINQLIPLNDLFLNYKKDCKESYNHIFLHAKNLIHALPTN